MSLSSIRGLAAIRLRSSALGLCQRSLTTTPAAASVARTYPTKPVPGSKEDTDPYAWAKRLFRLRELREGQEGGGEKGEPPLLNMICRLMPMKGLPFYERAMLELYGIGNDVKTGKWVLVKNVPSVNKDLLRIKHLIRVQPVRFPQGLPETEDDIRNCVLRPNGDFLIRKPLRAEASPAISKSAAAESPELPEKVVRVHLSKRYLKDHHNRQYSAHRLLQEHFTSHYRYELNEDGQEFRYSGRWRLSKAMEQSARRRRNADGTRRPNLYFEADYNTYPWRYF